MDHINCRCIVHHTKESNVKAFRIIESEPTLTLQKLSSFPLFSPIIVLFRIIYSGNHVRSRLYNPDCISFRSWSSQKTCFYTFFDCIKCRYTLCNHSLPINTLQTLHNFSHHPLPPSPPLPQFQPWLSIVGLS